MNLLEERLREGLDALADDARVGVRVEDVVAAGEGVRRQRTIRRSIAGVAAAVLAGIGGWFVLSPHPMTVQPAPLATPSVSSTRAEAYFGFETGTPTVRHTVAITSERRGDQLAVRVTDSVYGRDPVTRDFVAPAGRYFAATVKDELGVAIIPEPTRGVACASSRNCGAQSWSAPDAGLTIVQLWNYDKRSTATLLWRDAGNRVFSSEGREVPTLTLATPNTTLTLFNDATSGAWGAHTDLPDTFSAQSGDPLRAEKLLFIQGSRTTSVGRLPDGARDVTITPVEADAQWTTGTMSDGSSWFMVRSSMEYPLVNRLVQTISYTDAKGQRITYTPKKLFGP